MSTEGEIHAVIRGQARIKLHDVTSEDPYLEGMVDELPLDINTSDEVVALAKELSELFKKAINLGKQAEIMTVMRLVSGQVEPVELVDQIASLLELKTVDKQKLLETLSLKERLDKVFKHLSQEVNVLEIERTISNKTQKRFESQMRKAMLREKKRTIEEELGEEEGGDLGSEEFTEYKKKIKEAQMPPSIREKAEKELKKLTQISPHNPEGSYIRSYLDWLCDMPWSKATPNNVSIKRAVKILEDEHYGLKKAKERIIEYLAVMKIKASSKKKSEEEKPDQELESQPTILCFIGPPGV
jgi:ATP-dependent Lon protease